MKQWLAIAALSLAVGLGCAGRTKLEGTDRVTKDGVMSIWANWVKDKGDKYDIQLNLKNESDQSVIVLLNNINCFRGTTPGSLKHTFFNTGERTIDFGPQQLKSFNLVCKYNGKVKGPYKIVVNQIRENTSGDGATANKVIADKLEWSLTDGAATAEAPKTETPAPENKSEKKQ